ncbi:hypothetical protein LSG31_08185 [Fodinisporobacter ferrooxydans]|uniref:Uncharacterized protein n=1 Tax=Fodinisporobacter ferrooxydans TaxID=2901836 RepID=A0ABY4CNV5_9BACL|nr:hypothetical protein LSG31_08185 [Alicyclobacillaceae bacterium MYW30-H2]
MSNQDKQKRLIRYRMLYRLFSFFMLASIVFCILGLIAGTNGFLAGFTIALAGFLLGLVSMPMYFIYRSRFLKTRLAVEVLQNYTNKS